VALIRQAEYGDVRYTLDGSDPIAASPEYREPLTVLLPHELRAASFIGGERVSTPRTIQVDNERALHRGSHDLKLCTNSVALALEDDAPLTGPRAVFLMDIENPCWIYPAARLRGVTAVAAAVGQVPFNFQIGADRERMHFATPQTPSGELEVHLDDCNGEVYARMPLETALANPAVTVLPVQPVRTIDGDHDLCIRFAQRGVDPLWALDWIELRTGAQPSAAAGEFQ
jgi:hexosaminidase